jgi:hypothetical protein
MFANCQAKGKDLAPSDVCKTPPGSRPVPYPNEAKGNEAIPNVPNVIWVGGPVHNLNTIIPMTPNDEAGSELGVASGTVSSKSQHMNGASRVIVMGAPVSRLTSTNQANSNNTTGTRIEPSQTKIMVLAG